MNGWPEVALQDVLERLIDYRGKSPTKSETGIPVISAKVVKSGRILEGIEQTIAPEYYSAWMRRGLPAVGDVVMTTEGPLGEVAQLDHETVKYALGQRIVTMRGRPGVLDNGFLKYLLMSSEVQERLHSRATGSTVAGISQASLRSMTIPIAPYAEQHEIASILGTLDDKIELNRRMAATLEEMAQALYQSWFVNFDPVKAKSEGLPPAFMDEATAALFPDRFGDDGLPEGWRMLSFVETIDIISGGTPKTSEPTYWGGMIPWYSVVDAPGTGQIFVSETEKMITESGLRNSPSRLVPRGTTIISARGTVGKLAMTARPMTFNQSCYGLRSRHVRGDAFCYFATERAVGELQSRSHGSVFSTITRQTFEGIDVIDCSDAVQVAFADRVDPYMARICSIVEENRTLAALRDTLLPKLMSGELRVGEARDRRRRLLRWKTA